MRLSRSCTVSRGICRLVTSWRNSGLNGRSNGTAYRNGAGSADLDERGFQGF